MMRKLFLLAALMLSSVNLVNAATNASGAQLHSITTSRSSLATSHSAHTGVSFTLAIGDTFHRASSNASGATLQSDLAPRPARITETTQQTAWFFY